jgi:phthalate 4,5-dioxygenase
MTTATEGAQLTQIGPGTVMGDLMRQYWIPAALSSELERDSAPIRLMLLGEKLIAFRDSTGHVGVVAGDLRHAARRIGSTPAPPKNVRNSRRCMSCPRRT